MTTLRWLIWLLLLSGCCASIPAKKLPRWNARGTPENRLAFVIDCVQAGGTLAESGCVLPSKPEGQCVLLECHGNDPILGCEFNGQTWTQVAPTEHWSRQNCPQPFAAPPCCHTAPPGKKCVPCR